MSAPVADEREIKLAVDEDFVMPPLESAEIRANDCGVEKMTATYWDTPALQLARSSFGLRHRTDRAWTLKSPSRRAGDLFVRHEEESDGSPKAVPESLVR